VIGRIFRSRWFRGTAVTVLILLLVVTLVSLNGYYSVRHRGEQHQMQVLAELDAADPGWRFDQIQAARQAALPPPETNVIEQAVKLADRFPEEQYREWQKSEPKPPDPPPKPGDLPTDEELAHARKLTELCRDLIPEARGLRHLSGGVIVPLAENPIATRLPHLDKAGRVFLLLQHDATASAADGKTDDALDAVLAVLAIARGFDDDPYLVAHLFRLRFLAAAVRMVERTLRQGEATDAKLAEVQEAFAAAAAAKVKGYVTALRGERAGMTKLADLLEKDPGQADGLIDSGTKPPKVAVAVAASALLPETHARYLELMTRAIAIAEKPAGPDRTVEFAQLDADLKADTSLEGNALRLVFPAIHKCYDADVRTTALLLSAAHAIGLERVRLRKKGVLEEVGYPPEDPFTGKPLLFKRFPDGIAVYSTGPDGKDDGGENLADGGTKAGFDWGVRLYDGKRR
jgi:hypothetical protein